MGNVILLNMDGREVRSLEPRSSPSLPDPQPQFCTPDLNRALSAALESENAQKESDPRGPEPVL